MRFTITRVKSEIFSVEADSIEAAETAFREGRARYLMSGDVVRATPNAPTEMDGSLSLSEKLRNAAAAAGRVVVAAGKGQKLAVSEEERERRLAICQSCEFFTGTTCLKCGCVIRFKAALATEHCPIQKW